VTRVRLTGGLLVLLLAGCSSPGAAGTADAVATTPARTPAPAATSEHRPSPAPAATFVWRSRPATRAALGSSWRPGCPVPPARLRIVHLTYWTFDGDVAEGDLVLHRDVVDRLERVFATMYRTRFPMRSVRPVTAYGSSDDRSMAADNTSAFNCRRAVAAGAPSWSRHAYGKAVDVNPVENPYLFRGEVLPPAGRRYVDRRRAQPGKIRRGDAVHQAFLAAGFRWGGDFSNPDYQHFDR
jgi:hypothetical protein